MFEFVDRRGELFGRQPDLDYLVERSQSNGVTAVVGQAKMGKSWLLTELVRQLSIEPAQNRTILNIGEQPCLVGFYESTGESDDILLRTVANLYARWFCTSNYLEQAKVVKEQQQRDFIGRTGVAFGSLVEQVSKLRAKPFEVVGGIVKSAFEALTSADRDLKSGRLTVPRLQSEQARELLALIQKVDCQSRFILVFDQWEKTLGLEKEVNILDAFVRAYNEWPPCHIFLGVRDRDEKSRSAVAGIEKINADEPDVFHIHRLKEMSLTDAEKIRLLAHLRKRVPIARQVGDEKLLELIAGYPRVVERWIAQAGRIKTEAELARAAGDAIAYRFRDLEELLPKLPDRQRKLSMRLALLPSSSNADDWKALGPVVAEGTTAHDMDALRQASVLDSDDPPTYGHEKKREAAVMCFKKRCRTELREICEQLVLSLASNVQDASQKTMPYSAGMLAAGLIGREIEVKDAVVVLCLCASSLYTGGKILGEALGERWLLGAKAIRTEHESAVPLLALGLLNALGAAKQQEMLELRDSLLQELRELADRYPDAVTVRRELAAGLFNALNQAEQEEKLELRDGLLQELRELAAQYPEDMAVRANLADGLFNVLDHAMRQARAELRDRLLQELRELADAYPSDALVRRDLADGLFNASNDARRQGKLESHDSLLQELRELEGRHPDDAWVREKFAAGLFNALNYAKQNERLSLLDALLRELRELAGKYRDDAAVRKQLAVGLFNTLNQIKKEEKPELRDSLLQELRELACKYPEDEAVRECVGISLFNTLVYAEEEKLDLRDELLRQLRELAAKHPDDAAVRAQLAKGLVITLIDSKEKGKAELYSALVAELVLLVRDHWEDDAMKAIAELINRVGNVE